MVSFFAKLVANVVVVDIKKGHKTHVTIIIVILQYWLVDLEGKVDVFLFF
jgi:hypothetical protein